MSQTTTTPGLPGQRERAERGPVLRKGIGPSTSGWFDPRGRAIGSWAFSVNRITGLGLVFYLYLHLGVLSLLLAGESNWNDFIELATNTLFLWLDVLLLFGILFHGLNGVRVALVGTGVVPEKQRALFWAFTIIGTVTLAAGAIHILGSA
jgi:succinate dehydrogenase / fumarate reductase cytochrome b subunit